jgi:signal transduction histidine kinase/CheY-like chemotaxis protein/HPt (histidine-containing phosphotransfer) domain-containing protein
MFINLLTVVDSFAEETDLQKKIAIIDKIEDKSKALQTLTDFIASPSNTAEHKVVLLLRKARLYFGLHRYNEGISTAILAKNIALEFDLANQQAKIDKLLGILFYYQGELDKALNAYLQSLAYYQDNQDKGATGFALERANLFNNIALVHTSMGEPGQALVYYERAEPLYAKYGDEVDKIDVRYNIATLYLSLKRFDSAINILHDVIKRRQQINDDHGVASAKADLGISYKHSGLLSLALDNISAALNYFQQHDYQHDIASQLHNISELYFEMLDVDNAILYGEKALLVSEQVGHKKAYAGSLQSLAKAAFYQGNLELATDYINRSTNTAKQINYQTLLTENLAISALFSAANSDFIGAVSQQKQYGKTILRMANSRLNDKLAEFESVQLNQRIVDLEQRRKLHNLQSDKMRQQRNIIILSLVLVLLVLFFIYRYYLQKKLSTDLELRVKERTSELEKLSLDLERAGKVKSQFLANISHEIRTPLTAIIGHAEALPQSYHDDPQSEKNLQIIHHNSKHLLELINDILDLSRIEANKFELNVQPEELGELVRDIFNTFSAQAQLKQLSFSVNQQLTLPFHIDVDGMRLKQILINLCANAIKFTEQGSITLDVNWRRDTLTVVVADTGIGLSDNDLSQIFEMFTQADNTISRRFGGSGLGLTLSSQLATLMSGHITVQSTPGKGSRFTLSLPCQASTKPVTLSPSDSVILTGTVLLAEDHDDNRRLISRLLEKRGLQVILARNGKEAVAGCIKHQPQLVLLDIQMPEMDGVAAYKAIRASGYEQPIFALTANAMSHEVKQYLSLGFTGHLKKPIERQHFFNVLSQYLIPAFNQQFPVLDNKASDLSDLITDFKLSLIKDKAKLLNYNIKEDIDKIAHLVHRLCGAAQMFGFKELSQVAQELDNILKESCSSSIDNQQAMTDLIECLIDEIRLIERG